MSILLPTDDVARAISSRKEAHTAEYKGERA
jgi:hypothetical protein